MKTWTWRESVPSSTYLITVVAGELEEVKDSFHGLPLTYYAPKGRGDRLMPNYNRTPAMIDLFNKKIGVDYPWEKYAQVMVDDFVAGGMENSSATTNTANSLKHPKLIPEYPTNEDDLISHELAHQWFGDLVTCKDWGDVWLNEGFATFFEAVWKENHYSKDEADYDRWTANREWFGKTDLYAKPVVRFDFDDSEEFDGNAYGKGGFVLYMLRHQIGEESFWRGIKHYLEVNRGKNVVTADLIRAIEEANHINVDRFFHDWIFGAGAPRFDLAYTYDDAKQQDRAEGETGSEGRRSGRFVPCSRGRGNHDGIWAETLSDHRFQRRRDVLAAIRLSAAHGDFRQRWARSEVRGLPQGKEGVVVSAEARLRAFRSRRRRCGAGENQE